MKKIEIDTAQKVTIQYELASVGQRFLAYFIDGLIVMGTIIILGIIGIQAVHWQNYQYYSWLILAPIFIFYSLVSEIMMDGQTIGKRALSLKVVKLNGDAPSAHDYFIRWMFRFIDIHASFGSIGVLLITSSPQSQRLGDLLSGSVVIRQTPSKVFSLRDILKISTIENYTPLYPQVTQLRESDMLFVKECLERLRRFPNNAHRDAVNQLSKQLASLLQIESVPQDRLKFLRTLLNDYIVLTR